MEEMPRSYWPGRLTTVLLLCVFSAWTLLNAIAYDQYWGFEASTYTHHGFPCDAVITYDYRDLFIEKNKRVDFSFEVKTYGDKYCWDIVTPYASAVLVPVSIIVNLLFALGLSIGAIVLSRLLSHWHRRGWLKFRLATAVLLTVAGGVLLSLNMRPDKLGFYYGFPQPAISSFVLDGEVSEGYPGQDDEEPFPFNFRLPILNLSIILSPFVQDVLFAVSALTGTAIVSELIIRRALPLAIPDEPGDRKSGRAAWTTNGPSVK